MLSNLGGNTNDWLKEYFIDFRKRFTKLLPKAFKKFSMSLGLATITNQHVALNKSGIID
jgi:hypothetical protein